MIKNSEKNNQSEITENTFGPLQQIVLLKGSWWILLITMIAGALVGYALHFIFPPLYSSSGEITSSIDYTRTGALTDVEEDIAIVTIGDILSSTTVVQNTIEAGKNAGLDPEDFVLEETAFLERYNFTYSLVVQNTDNQTASQWANLWLEIANQAISEARMHALTADQLYNQLMAYQQCMENSGQVYPVAAICQNLTQPELQERLALINQNYNDEKEKSLAVLPAMDFVITRIPEPATEAERQQKGVLVFSGAILGAILFLTWFIIKGNVRRSH
jgi:LPS O-antigen subunit length determinant protein (WzzB/FepE family)